MTGPTETTRAHAGQTFELPLRCRECGREFYVPVNLGAHRCEPAPNGFKAEAAAQDEAKDS